MGAIEVGSEGSRQGDGRARQRMPMSERAKIFVPFDPLKGYRELLEAREREAVRDAGELGPGMCAKRDRDRTEEEP